MLFHKKFFDVQIAFGAIFNKFFFFFKASLLRNRKFYFIAI